MDVALGGSAGTANNGFAPTLPFNVPDKRITLDARSVRHVEPLFAARLYLCLDIIGGTARTWRCDSQSTGLRETHWNGWARAECPLEDRRGHQQVQSAMCYSRSFDSKRLRTLTR